jgi:hypothetical protein
MAVIDHKKEKKMKEKDGNVINFPKEGADQLPAQVVQRILGGKTDVRIAIAKHPLMGEFAPCVPYRDYAEVFSYDDQSIFKIIQRTKWLKKYSTTSIMEAVDGKMRPQLCIFEEAMLGIFMKLLPQKCKDKEVAARIDQLQEEMILTLRDVLRGYKTQTAGYPFGERQGLLPRPGLSMDAIATLCKEADKYLRGKASLKALNFYGGMPVDDLLEELEATEAVNSTLGGTIAQYFDALREVDAGKFEIRAGVSDAGDPYLEGAGRSFHKAFVFLQHARKLPKFFGTAAGLSYLLGREAPALEYMGIRRIKNNRILNGRRFHRFEFTREKGPPNERYNKTNKRGGQ